MRSNFLKSALIAAAFLVPLSAMASDGTITFSGSLTASTCLINGGTGSSFTVPMPAVSTANLASAGQTGGGTYFELQLTNCTPTIATARTYFEAGGTIDLASGRLINSGTAGNVQIRLKNASGSVINLAEDILNQGVTPVTIVGQAGTASFIAEYYATGATTAGTVASSVTYSMNYN